MKLDQKVIKKFLEEIMVSEKIPKDILIRLNHLLTNPIDMKDESIIKIIEEGFRDGDEN